MLQIIHSSTANTLSQCPNRDKNVKAQLFTLYVACFFKFKLTNQAKFPYENSYINFFDSLRVNDSKEII